MEALKIKKPQPTATGNIFELFALHDIQPVSSEEIIYPESDGEPMADNTKQYEWIVKIKEGLESLYADSKVFVAADLLWYPVQGDNMTKAAPDVMVAFDRPKGDRGSYLQWKENGIAPHVVFEILSPGNRPKAMHEKFRFYERYGVEEYYIYDPDNIEFTAWIRSGNRLRPVENTQGWVSPRLKISFVIRDDELIVTRPNGEKFLSPLEIERCAKIAKLKAEAEKQRADKAEKAMNAEKRKTEKANQKATKAKEKAEKANQKATKAKEKAEKERQKATKAKEKAEKERQKATKAKEKTEKERQKAKKAKEMAEKERQKATKAKEKAEKERQKAEKAEILARKLAEKLRAMGIDPETI